LVVFTTTELQVLAALAEGQTLTQIGEDIFLSHSSVSKVLRAAERKSGLQLVEHEGRRLKLTSSGVELANSARAAVDELRAVDRTIEALRKGSIGTVRILSGATPTVSLLPRLLARFLQLETAVTPIVRIERGDVWTRFAREGYDLGVGRGKPRSLSNATTRWLLDDELVLFVARAEGEDAPLTWEDVRDSTLIGPFSSPLFSQALEQLNRRGFRGHLVEAESYASVQHMVELGVGVGIQYRLALTQELVTNRIKVVTIPDFSARVPYWLAIRAGARSARMIDRLVALLLDEVAATFGDPARTWR
jgi:DNA-binding transcriptional LysR family regulator